MTLVLVGNSGALPSQLHPSRAAGQKAYRDSWPVLAEASFVHAAIEATTAHTSESTAHRLSYRCLPQDGPCILQESQAQADPRLWTAVLK